MVREDIRKGNKISNILPKLKSQSAGLILGPPIIFSLIKKGQIDLAIILGMAIGTPLTLKLWTNTKLPPKIDSPYGRFYQIGYAAQMFD